MVALEEQLVEGLVCQAVGAGLPELVGGSPRLVGEPGACLAQFISDFGGVRDQISCPEYCAQNVCVCVCLIYLAPRGSGGPPQAHPSTCWVVSTPVMSPVRGGS